MKLSSYDLDVLKLLSGRKQDRFKSQDEVMTFAIMDLQKKGLVRRVLQSGKLTYQITGQCEEVIFGQERKEMKSVPLSRAVAYGIIDEERDYQDSLFAGTLSGNRKIEGDVAVRSVDEFAAYLQGYQNELIRLVSTSSDDMQKMNVVRKMAALAVQSIEQHGAPRRRDT